MTVINTSPLIHLSKVLPRGLEHLAGLVGEVIVPYEVAQELAAGSERDDAYFQLRAVSSLVLRDRPVALDGWLKTEIDLGEAAVIQTALNEGAGTVILDDLKARRIARRLGLSVTGTLGILIQAKLAGEIPSVGSAIQKLRDSGMWLDPQVVSSALQMAGELE